MCWCTRQEQNPNWNSIKKGNIKSIRNPIRQTVLPSSVSRMPLFFSSAQLFLKAIKEETKTNPKKKKEKKVYGLEALKPGQSTTTSSLTGLLGLDGVTEIQFWRKIKIGEEKKGVERRKRWMCLCWVQVEIRGRRRWSVCVRACEWVWGEVGGWRWWEGSGGFL